MRELLPSFYLATLSDLRRKGGTVDHIIDCTVKGLALNHPAKVQRFPRSQYKRDAMEIEEIDAIVDFIVSALDSGKKVALHHQRGTNHTLCAAAAVLLAMGKDLGEPGLQPEMYQTLLRWWELRETEHELRRSNPKLGLLAYCVRMAPAPGLMHATELLSTKQVNDLVESDFPWALEHTPELISAASWDKILSSEPELFPWILSTFPERIPQNIRISMAEKYPEVAVYHAAHLLPPDLVLTLVEKTTSRQFTSAMKDLPDDVLLKVVRRRPKNALRYVADRLPLDLLIEVAKEDPREAFYHALHLLPAEVLLSGAKIPNQFLLPPEVFMELVRQGRAAEVTRVAMELGRQGRAAEVICVAADLLPDEVLEKLAPLSPGYALQYAGTRLSHDVLWACAKAAPGAALQYHVDLFSDEEFAVLARLDPNSALRFALHRFKD